MVTLAAKRDILDEEEFSLFQSALPQQLYFNFLSFIHAPPNWNRLGGDRKKPCLTPS